MNSPIRWRDHFFELVRSPQWPSSGFDDFACGYATGADHNFLGPPVVHGAHALQIGLETALGHVVRMTDVAAHHGLFPTYFTYFSHRLVSTGSNITYSAAQIAREFPQTKHSSYVFIQDL
jgi:hypothetical protein